MIRDFTYSELFSNRFAKWHRKTFPCRLIMKMPTFFLNPIHLNRKHVFVPHEIFLLIEIASNDVLTHLL